MNRHCYHSCPGAPTRPTCRNPNLRLNFLIANIKSQKKRNRQNETARQRNKTIMSDLKTSIKKVEVAAAAGESTDELFQDAQKKIDVAAQKGVLHANTAARKKSRLKASLST